MIERYMGGSRVSMKRRFGLVLAASVLLTGCAARMTEMQRLQAQNSYERALSQLNQGQSALALSSLQEATTLNPRSALYHDTLSLDPQLPAAYYNLGLVLTAEKRPEEAKALFRRVRQIAPESPFGQAALERLRALGEGG